MRRTSTASPLGGAIIFGALGSIFSLAPGCTLANEFAPVAQREPLACEAEPCRALEPQCGCEEGQMCALTGGQNVCVEPVGRDPLGGSCEGLSCEPGLSCLGFDGSSRLCLELCEAQADCREAGAECVVPLSSDSVSACSVPCDLQGTAGCASGMKCAGFINDGAWYRVCVDAGTLGQDAPCDRQGDCGIGFFCVPPASGAASACLAYCLKDEDDCPIAYACASFSTPLVVDDVELGVCVPAAGG